MSPRSDGSNSYAALLDRRSRRVASFWEQYSIETYPSQCNRAHCRAGYRSKRQAKKEVNGARAADLIGTDALIVTLSITYNRRSGCATESDAVGPIDVRKRRNDRTPDSRGDVKV